MKKLGWALLLVVVAVGERVWWDLGPNIELVTMAMILAASYLGKNWAMGVVLVSMGISDLMLGNSNIWLFTWSGFLIPVLWMNKEPGVVKGVGMGLGANLFFYAWTNFGVWLLDSWGMYSNDVSGLINAYINGLPFLKLQVFSTLLFLPAALVVMEVWRTRLWQQSMISR